MAFEPKWIRNKNTGLKWEISDEYMYNYFLTDRETFEECEPLVPVGVANDGKSDNGRLDNQGAATDARPSRPKSGV